MGLRCSEWAGRQQAGGPYSNSSSSGWGSVIDSNVVDGAAFALEAVGGSGACLQEVTEMESGTA